MSRIAHVALAAVGLILIAVTAEAAPLSSAAGGALQATGASPSELIHLKPGDHCHPHGHSKLCHGANDYPALYPRAERKPDAPHRHTRLCRH